DVKIMPSHNAITFTEPFYETTEEIKAPEVELPKEWEGLGERLTSKAGLAELTLGKKVVASSKELVNNMLKGMGYSAHINVAHSENDTLILAVALDKQRAFKVPLKIKDGIPLRPTVIVANDQLKAFTAESLLDVLSGE